MQMLQAPERKQLKGRVALIDYAFGFAKLLDTVRVYPLSFAGT